MNSEGKPRKDPDHGRYYPIRTRRGPGTAKRINKPSAMVGASMAKAKLLGFDKPDQHKTDVTIINETLPFPTKESEMSVEEWIARGRPRRSSTIRLSPPVNGHDNGD